jgi:gamma-glutamyltranspeptidase/glutathione hydrolase
MLLNGGNAVDAAIATAVALTVLEPVSCGIGGDAFAMVWDGTRLHAINGSGRAGRRVSLDLFEGRSTIPTDGWPSVTVPGVVATWMELSRKLGKLPFARLFEPAIEYAELGAMVPPHIARVWKAIFLLYRKHAGIQELFGYRGRTPEAGELVRLPRHAATLREIADTGGESFYRGRIADLIVEAGAGSGFGLGRDDLAEHTSDWVEPLSVRYRDHEVFELPPNGQGLAALNALGILDHFDFAGMAPDSAAVAHIQIEAMKLAFADVYRYVGDARHKAVDPVDFLDPAYLRARAALIDPDRARFPTYGLPKDAGTVYLASGDSAGMMVSMMQSNGRGFGSGIVIPGTGICMHNRGSAFCLDEHHPNCFGPGKRPFHTIVPAFIARGGTPAAAFGVMGFNMQPQAHVQLVSRMVDFRQGAQQLCDAPRWRIAHEEPAIVLEDGFDSDTRNGLVERHHSIVETEQFDAASTPFGSALAFGSAQVVMKHEEGFCAASDPRRDGQPAGY